MSQVGAAATTRSSIDAAGSSPPNDALVEVNFDGLVGPTHTHAGLSPGNLASTTHAGLVANPRQAALQGLAKMRFMHRLGLPQAVLPPHERPNVHVLRQLGFAGDDAAVLRSAEQTQLLQVVSSASAMWTANAATVIPSRDSIDGRLHLTVANLTHLFHRHLETRTTARVMAKIFSDPALFCLHAALPGGGQFADEGAANHTRLETEAGVLHLFGWGRRAWGQSSGPKRHAARQTLEASLAVARLSQLDPHAQLLWQQHPDGIDAGAFHSDVLAVGNGNYLLMHELAFVEPEQLELEIKRRLGPGARVRRVTDSEVPVADAVSAYPFNSQLVTLPSGAMALIAPRETEANPACRALVERLLGEGPITQVFYQDVTGSMQNGGGPACLRLRVALTRRELAALGAGVLVDDTALETLEQWVQRHYREELRLSDLSDPALLIEVRTALDELSGLLGLGSVYDFQR